MFKKVLLTVVICVSILICSGEIAKAQSNSSYPYFEPAKIIGIEALDLISLKSCSISQSGKQAIVVVEGFTTSQFTVDYLAVTLYLERWDGSKWVSVASKAFTDRNTSYVDGIYSTSVQKGDRYRVKGHHTATNGSKSESIYTYSNAIEIK